MAEPESLNPADEPLTLLEETVLLVLARGEFMAPIGRWGDTLQGLTQRGLAERRDEMNYAITARGRQVAEAKDDRFVRGWINDSNRAALSRRGLPVTAADVERNGGKIEADMTEMLRQDVSQFNRGATGDYYRLTGSPVNDTMIERDPLWPAPDVGAAAGVPMGCVCPPTSEQTCQNPLCPRKAPAR